MSQLGSSLVFADGSILRVGSAAGDSISGSALGDQLWGMGGNDVLSGGAESDELNGGDGNDSLSGGAGYDYLYGGAGNDTLDGGSGESWEQDHANYYDATSAVNVNLGAGFATGGAGTDTLIGIEAVNGSAYNDTLTGDGNHNYLYGGDGSDNLSGGDGDDGLQGGSGNDRLDGGAGTDYAYFWSQTGAVTVNLSLGTASGGDGADTLIGIENVYGSEFADTLIGDASGNWLGGEQGNDTLTGGAGSDTFRVDYNGSYDTSVDTVTDFVAGVGGDKIYLHTWNFTNFSGSSNPFTTGHTRLTQSGTDTLLQIDLDGSTGTSSSFQTAMILKNVSSSALVAANFVNGFDPNVDPNNDSTFYVSAVNWHQFEGNSGTTPFSFTVYREGNTSVAESLTWSASESGTYPATMISYYGTQDVSEAGQTWVPGGTVSFAAGQTTATVTLNILGDTENEQNEEFQINFSANYVTLATGHGTIYNDDDHSTLAIAATNAVQYEGNDSNESFEFVVTRSGDTSGGASVDWIATGSGANPANLDGYGTGGLDRFTSAIPQGTVSFAAGQTSATVWVSIQGDTSIESDEGFSVTLSNAGGSTIGVATAYGTILNDDGVVADTTAPTATTFSPADEATGVAVASNIVVTFNEAIARGTGSIVLKTSTGSTVATYDAASSTNLSISGSLLTITINPSLTAGTGYKVEFAVGSIKDLAGNNYVDTTNYNFTTAATTTPVPTVSYTVPGTLGNDFFIPNAGNKYQGGRGDDTYIISPYTLSGPVTATLNDREGSNVIEFVDGMTIASSSFYSNEAVLTLANGASLLVLSADRFTYRLGANASAGDSASDLSNTQFGTLLGASVPTSGILPVSGTANYVVPGSAAGNGFTQVNLSSGTVTAGAAAEEFRYDFQIVGGRVAKAGDGEVTITGFDVAKDKLVFVNTSNTTTYTEAEFSALGGVDVSQSLSQNFTAIDLDSFAGNPGGVKLTGIVDQALAQIVLETV